MPSFTAADEDDDAFGEFKFISSPHHNNNNNHGDDDDEDWGDFVQSPHTHSNSNSKDWGDFVQSPHTHSNSNSNNHWEKLKGAIPLSIFGVIEEEDEQEEESPDPTQFPFNNNNGIINSNGFSSPTHVKPFTRDGKDLEDDGGIQEAYIATWSRIASACARELHHGAMIWKESVDANVSKEILSQGRNYFAALVEIFGVTEILRATLKLHKAWMALTPEHCSRELTSSLEKCVEAWTLLPSFAATTELGHLLSEVDGVSFQNRGSVICRLSLLPVDQLRGVKVVTWDGHHYCLKLANFWANRVSCCPPQLPPIGASYFS